MQYDRLPLTRKARSATKVKDIESFISTDIKEHARLSSTSASNYSSRRIRSLNELKSVNFDDRDEHFKRTDNKNKLFLYASQVLGKMKKYSSQYEVYDKVPSLDMTLRHLNVRKVNFYCDLLKRLLEQRCILLLDEESWFCIKQTQKLVADLKIFYTNEMIKLTTMPIKTYNRFIDSSDISIIILQLLFKKVNYICDLHSSLKNNYQKIINFFHVGFDMELYQKFLKINKFLNNHYSEMFYWTHKILEVFILKLCLADSDLISPEFLHHVVEICGLFNSLFLNKKGVKYIFFTYTHNSLLNCCTQFDYEAILLDFILHYLSHFEAKVAAEKIIQFLIFEGKNRNNALLKEKIHEKEVKDKPMAKSDTSDYCSASPTVIDIENTRASISDSFSFSNIYLSLLQRNQSLVLKYLYSIICLDTSMTSKCKNDEICRDSSTTIKSWNLSQNMYKNKSYLHLEERYWTQFWQKVFTYILKVTLEVPRHQYGNAAVGVFLFWPQSFCCGMLSYLRSCAETTDMSFSGLDVIQKVYHTLLIQTVCESWDKKMTKTLSVVNGQPFMPILVASNGVRTRIGNALCCCLQVLRLHISKDSLSFEIHYQEIFNLFGVTLDCLIYFNNIEARASVSSGDLSTYLFLSRSDCVYACKLIEEKESFDAFLKRRHVKLFSFSNQNTVIKQIETLAGHISEASNVIYQTISCNVKRKTLYMLKKSYEADYHTNMLQSRVSLKELLNSFTETINHISDRTSVLSAVTSAVAHELFYILQLIQRKLSKKKVQVLKGILHDFLNWLEQQKMDPSEKNKLKDMNCLNKVLCIMQILESTALNQRYCLRGTNKVIPLDKDVERCTVLTEEEILHWQLCIRHKFFLCF